MIISRSNVQSQVNKVLSFDSRLGDYRRMVVTGWWLGVALTVGQSLEWEVRRLDFD